MNTIKMISLGLRILIAGILLQTLFFKFTAHPDSVHILSILGIEPWGRVGLGIVELIVALLTLIPKTKFLGVLCSLCIMVGAISSHFFALGVEVKGDGGGLFILAMVVLTSCISFIIIHKKDYKALLSVEMFKKG